MAQTSYEASAQIQVRDGVAGPTVWVVKLENELQTLFETYNFSPLGNIYRGHLLYFVQLPITLIPSNLSYFILITVTETSLSYHVISTAFLATKHHRSAFYFLREVVGLIYANLL